MFHRSQNAAASVQRVLRTNADAFPVVRINYLSAKWSTLPDRLVVIVLQFSDAIAWWWRRFLEREIPECFADGVLCRSCGDVHREGAQCPRLVIGFCQVCWREATLDKFGNCLMGGHREIVNRRSASNQGGGAGQMKKI